MWLLIVTISLGVSNIQLYMSCTSQNLLSQLFTKTKWKKWSSICRMNCVTFCVCCRRDTVLVKDSVLAYLCAVHVRVWQMKKERTNSQISFKGIFPTSFVRDASVLFAVGMPVCLLHSFAPAPMLYGFFANFFIYSTVRFSHNNMTSGSHRIRPILFLEMRILRNEEWSKTERSITAGSV